MQGILPAAGEGTRLRPLTDDRPKGLVAIGGKPILTTTLVPTPFVVIGV